MAEQQFVVFRLGEEMYAAHIYNVQEIIFPEQPTKVPNNPDFIEGVIDYRGTMVPVMDLKKRFHLGEAAYKQGARFIIAEVGDVKAAFIVDEVTEVLRVDDSIIGEAPDMTKIKKEYISGMAKLKDKLVVILDLSKIFTVEEKEVISAL
ncbi:MAG: chemotaxis protein CheW [Xylanivirga thermophila]|uniref:chemotaxis protein CheW n=1 Tax=Xylanivirga thermophila TaxID=2496273 RepID=UPI00101C17B6|nr:chemotaxis protein CheW [Xylanivirga thermophila]